MEEECCQLVSLRMSWKQAECKPCSQKPRQASLAGLQNQLLTLIAPHLFLLPKTRSVIVYRNHLPKQRVVLLLIRISKNRFIDVKYQVVKCKVHRCQTIWKYGPLGVFFHQTYVSQTSFIYEFDEFDQCISRNCKMDNKLISFPLRLYISILGWSALNRKTLGTLAFSLCCL